MRNKSRLVVAIIVCLLLFGQRFSSPTRADTSGAPLLVLMGGDILAWTAPDSPVVNLTNSGWVQAATISPDGKSIAYLDGAKLAQEAWKKRRWKGGFPYDVMVLDLATGKSTLIAGQPKEAKIVDSGGISPNTGRSFPVWSPDSKMLAWSEMTTQKPLIAVIYDLTAHKVRASKAIERIDVYTQLFWGPSGIAFLNMTKDKDNSELIIEVDNADGKMIASTPSDQSYYLRWVKDGDHDYIYIPEFPELFEPSTGKIQEVTSPFELYGVNTADGASVYESDPDKEILSIRYPGLPDFALNYPDNPVQIELQNRGFYYGVAISPDGKSVAFIHDNTVAIYQDGKVIETGIKNQSETDNSISSILWGGLAWRIHH